MEASRAQRSLEELTEAQHGVVWDPQLLSRGISRKAILYRVGSGRLIRIHPGVYAVGHQALTVQGRWLAAVFACGPRAVLSHLSAAGARGWIPSGHARIWVTVPSRSGRRTPDGIRLIKVMSLGEHEVGVLDEIPITSAARTVVDCAAVMRPRELEQLVLASIRGHDFHLPDVERVMTEHPRRAGSAALRKVLNDLGARDAPEVRSEVEVLFLEICDRYKLPEPLTNTPVLGYTVDVHWPGTNLIIELDGWDWHRGRTSFENDRARDRELTLAGYRVVRFTGRQLRRRPAEVAQQVRTLLSQSLRA